MKKAFVIIFSIFTLGVFSQNAKKHPIDIREEKCIDKADINNAEVCNCIIKAEKEWDTELNKYYNLLKSKLKPEEFEILKASQKQWIIYRDKEFKFITKYFFEMKQGTMWYSMADGKCREIVKSRALELKYYYDVLEY